MPITIVKRNGNREAFDRSKLLRGIARSAEKTDLSLVEQENIVDEIEVVLQQQAGREVTSQELGELVLAHLRQLNEVAYVRFASVYQQFTGIRDFAEALNHLKAAPDINAAAPELSSR